MPDFSQSKIYKLVCNITGKVYIGSTTRPLNYRLNQHLHDFKKGVKITSSQIFEKANYNIILIENYPCKNKKELHLREKYYINNNDCINKKNPIGRKLSPKSYYEKNKEIIKQQSFNNSFLKRRRREMVRFFENIEMRLNK